MVEPPEPVSVADPGRHARWYANHCHRH